MRHLTDPSTAADTDMTGNTSNKASVVTVRAWLQKLLVIVLCALSFYAGWQARHASMVRQCLQAGGQVSSDDNVYSCQLGSSVTPP